MSNSDSSEDEAMDQLLSAVDTSFLCEKLYETPPAVDDIEKRGAIVQSTPVPCAAAVQPVPRSNRYLVEEDSIFHSDLNVAAAVQTHVADKLSNLIGSIVEFDDSVNNQTAPRRDISTETGVRLLTGIAEMIDMNEHPKILQPTVKPAPITRRKIDCEPEVPDADRVAACICDPTAFPKEVQQWKGPRKRSILYHYKSTSDGTLIEKSNVLVNEFIKKRNARN